MSADCSGEDCPSSSDATAMPSVSSSVQSTTNVTAFEALTRAAKIEQQKEADMRILQEHAKIVEEERNLLQKIVYDVSNPSPIIITCIVLGTLLLMYIVYLVFIKPTLKGNWIDNYGNEYYIKHLPWQLTFYILHNGAVTGQGRVLDNYISLKDVAGVWNYDDEIIFVDGTVLSRLR